MTTYAYIEFLFYKRSLLIFPSFSNYICHLTAGLLIESFKSAITLVLLNVIKFINLIIIQITEVSDNIKTI